MRTAGVVFSFLVMLLTVYWAYGGGYSIVIFEVP